MATAGVMLFKGPQARRYTQKAVPTKGGRRFGRPDHRPAVRPAGRPAEPPEPTRPAVSAKFSAEILSGGLGRPSRPAEPPPSFSAEDRRRAPPPFHSDELCVTAQHKNADDACACITCCLECTPYWHLGLILILTRTLTLTRALVLFLRCARKDVCSLLKMVPSTNTKRFPMWYWSF